MGYKFADKPNDRIEDGTWAEFNGAEFLIASANSLRFQRYHEQLKKPHRSKFERGTVDPGLMLDIMIKAMASTVLLGWRYVSDDKGAPVEYTVSKAETFLRNDAHLREFVMSYSADLGNFQREEMEEEGNSSAE